MTDTGFTIKHDADFDRSGRWILARRSLELRSFGMNLVEIEPGGSIPEHDETCRMQEEVFIVLEGSAAALIDGVEHPAPAGTYVRLDRAAPDDRERRGRARPRPHRVRTRRERLRADGVGLGRESDDRRGR